MRKKLLVAGLAVVGLLAIVVPAAQAQGFRSGPSATVKAEETLNSTAWLAGDVVDVAGTVEGDVICAGQNVTISGVVQGDVLCAGQNVTISGTISGDVRAAAQTLLITGSVAGNVSSAGQTVTLGGEGQVGRDFSAAGSDVVVGARVGRDVFVAGENATITARIGRDVNAEAEHVRLEGSAQVQGKVNYTSRNDAMVSQTAQIGGGISHSVPSSSGRSDTRNANIAFALFMSVALVLTAMALVLIAPQFVDSAAQHTAARPLKAFLVGVIFLIIAPVIVIGLVLTIVGIPSALLALLVWLLVLALCGPVFAYTVGKLVWRGQDNAVLVMLAGSLILLITYFLPVVQVIGILASMTLGSGTVLLAIAKRIGRPAYRVAPQKA